jgi:hypothetical protein
MRFYDETDNTYKYESINAFRGRFQGNYSRGNNQKKSFPKFSGPYRREGEINQKNFRSSNFQGRARGRGRQSGQKGRKPFVNSRQMSSWKENLNKNVNLKSKYYDKKAWEETERVYSNKQFRNLCDDYKNMFEKIETLNILDDEEDDTEEAIQALESDDSDKTDEEFSFGKSGNNLKFDNLQNTYDKIQIENFRTFSTYDEESTQETYKPVTIKNDVTCITFNN